MIDPQGMVVRAARTLLLVSAVTLPARAQPSASEAPAGVVPTGAGADASAEAEAARTLRARRHFNTGIKLYKDADYRGALAEFEAAYREKPAPGSLQNVALSLKGLFRYAEAADALRLLIAQHSQDLTADERRAVQSALVELADLVGTLIVAVEPKNAVVTVNGRATTAAERAQGLRLNVGEHALIAEAPGYERVDRVIRIASQQRLSLPVKLQPTAGFLEVVAADPKAAIAIDGEPVAYRRWSGPVAPDIDHVVQIYRPGFEPYETTVTLELGQRLRVTGRLGPSTGELVDHSAPLPRKPVAPPELRTQRGLYFLAAAGIAGVNDAPFGLEVSSTDVTLASLGGRAGLRLSQTFGVEAAFDFGTAAADGACDRIHGEGCIDRNFSLSTVRFGPNLRLFTPGESIRFPITVGAGIVSHRVKLDGVEEHDLEGGEASGADPYFCLEFGAAYNYRHLLVELAVSAFIEGASELRGTFDGSRRVAAFDGGTLPLLGLTLKVGYSAWTPKR